MSAKYRKKPVKIDVFKLEFRHKNTLTFEGLYALLPGFQWPVGFIWYTHSLKRNLEIGYIFVHEQFRRQGVATVMLSELRRWYPGRIPCTGQGNEFSTGWLTKSGFKQTPDGWFLTPPNKK